MPARSSAPARSRECHAARVLQIVTGADLVLGVATGLLVGVALAMCRPCRGADSRARSPFRGRANRVPKPIARKARQDAPTGRKTWAGSAADQPALRRRTTLEASRPATIFCNRSSQVRNAWALSSIRSVRT